MGSRAGPGPAGYLGGAHPLRDVVQRHTIQVNHRDSMATSPTVTQATNILRKHFSNPVGSPPVASRLIETGL